MLTFCLVRHGPEHPRALGGLLAGSGTVGVLVLVSTCWWVRLFMRLEQAYWWAGPGPKRFWEWCLLPGGWSWVLGLWDLVLALWCIGLVPGPSSQWPLSLGGQPICWWVGLCPSSVSWLVLRHVSTDAYRLVGRGRAIGLVTPSL